MIEKYGLHGWKMVEASIIVAMATDMAICFKGEHGTSKTHAARSLSEAALGKVVKDKVTGDKHDPVGRAFNCSTTNFDELLGIISPNALKQDKLDYIKTGTSVWELDWALFDEINRVNPLIGSKFMELILDGSVNGQKTNLIYRFSAINPPGNATGYNSQYMDLAQASRFCFVDVPTAADLDDNNDLNAVFEFIHGGKPQDDKFEFKKLLRKVQDEASAMSKGDAKAIWDFVVKVQKVLNTRDGNGHRPVKFSTRQMRQLLEMTKVFVQLEKHAGIDTTYEAHANMIMGMVPEMNEVVQGVKIDILSLRQQILELIENEFVGSDPISKARNLEDLAKINASDELRYMEEFQKRVIDTDDIQELGRAFHNLKASGKSKNIMEPCSIAIRSQCVRLALDDTCGTTPVTAEALRKVESETDQILK